jgi:hypothetical protein
MGKGQVEPKTDARVLGLPFPYALAVFWMTAALFFLGMPATALKVFAIAWLHGTTMLNRKQPRLVVDNA